MKKKKLSGQRRPSYVIIVKILKEEVVNCQWPTLSFPRRRWWWWIGFFVLSFFFVCLFGCCSGIVACFVSTFQPRKKKKKKRHTSQIGWSDHQQNKPAAYHHRLSDYLLHTDGHHHLFPSLFLFFLRLGFDFADLLSLTTTGQWNVVPFFRVVYCCWDTRNNNNKCIYSNT